MNTRPRKRIAVVLFQLGGPATIDAVEPFLYNLFCDPDIIDFPLAFLARRPLARLISSTRARTVEEHYDEIGGGSPIRRLTEGQAAALRVALEPHVDATVVVAMRYWHPLTEEAITQLDGQRFEEMVLLPLYPHYSFATTRSSLKEWNRHYRAPAGLPVRLVEDFHNHPDYIEALVERINEAMAQMRKPTEAHLVFSAHGLPLKLVRAGDPYPRQIEETMRLVLEQGKWERAHTLCYQSRVGPQKWLQPSLVDTLPRLASAGVRRILVVPLSFVSEHIETLHEINIEAREQARGLGVVEFAMMPALNESPRFISALGDLVLDRRSAARS
jgi:ferrochelatase